MEIVGIQIAYRIIRLTSLARLALLSYNLLTDMATVTVVSDIPVPIADTDVSVINETVERISLGKFRGTYCWTCPNCGNDCRAYVHMNTVHVKCSHNSCRKTVALVIGHRGVYPGEHRRRPRLR